MYLTRLEQFQLIQHYFKKVSKWLLSYQLIIITFLEVLWICPEDSYKILPRIHDRIGLRSLPDTCIPRGRVLQICWLAQMRCPTLPF